MKPRSKSFVSSSPLNALAQDINVLGLFLGAAASRAVRLDASRRSKRVQLIDAGAGGGIENQP